MGQSGRLRPRRTPTGSPLGLFVLALFGLAAAGADAGAEDRPPPGIAVEILATDLAGRPVATLDAADILIHQDGVPQMVTRVAPRGAPGLFDVRYVPSSGRPGPMTVRSGRKGLLVRGPGGGELRPRVIPTPTALEADLLALLDRPASEGSALPAEVALYRFHAGPRGAQYVAAVEVNSAALAAGAPPGSDPRLQVVARLRRDDGLEERLLGHEQPVDATHRLVWTSHYELKEGPYTLEVVAREPVSKRHVARTIPFAAPAPRPGLHMSSVVFLQPYPARLALDPVAGDPLLHGGVPVLPALALTLPHQTDARARFYVQVYPDPKNPAPVSLRLEVLRDGTPVGAVPLTLSPPEDGRISYVGDVPTRTFRVAPYTLRLVAGQGDATVSDEATLRISDDPAVLLAPPVRMPRTLRIPN